jgi:hypothetical protein
MIVFADDAENLFRRTRAEQSWRKSSDNAGKDLFSSG